MSDYIDRNYIDSPETQQKLVSRSSTKELLKKPIDEDSLKTYGLSKPRRVTIKARVIHDPSET
ncbi:hypothetical protein TUM17382_12070 [Shewanella algae]|nr:hypothetical protein TUM17382_12070 [Shewanella algae]